MRDVLDERPLAGRVPDRLLRVQFWSKPRIGLHEALSGTGLKGWYHLASLKHCRSLKRGAFGCLNLNNQ